MISGVGHRGVVTPEASTGAGKEPMDEHERRVNIRARGMDITFTRRDSQPTP
jgi:hypothetical protein